MATSSAPQQKVDMRRVMSTAPTMNNNVKISMNYFSNDNQRDRNGKQRLCETYLTVCRLINEIVMNKDHEDQNFLV